MSYKVGDRVIIRDDFNAVASAEEFKGKEAKIMEVKYNYIDYSTFYTLDIDKGIFYWKDHLLVIKEAKRLGR